MIRELRDEYQTWVLEISLGKSDYLVIGTDSEHLQIGGNQIKGCDNLNISKLFLIKVWNFKETSDVE